MCSVILLPVSALILIRHGAALAAPSVMAIGMFLSKDASFFTHYYSHNVYSVKIKLNLEAKNALEK
jgi:hypothetical protein